MRATRSDGWARSAACRPVAVVTSVAVVVVATVTSTGVTEAGARTTVATVPPSVVADNGPAGRSIEQAPPSAPRPPAGGWPSAIVYHVNHPSPTDQFLALRSLHNHLQALDDDTTFELVLQGAGLRLLVDARNDPDRAGLIDVLLLHGVRLITDWRSIDALAYDDGHGGAAAAAPAAVLDPATRDDVLRRLYAADHLDIVPSVLFYLSEAQRRGDSYVKP